MSCRHAVGPKPFGRYWIHAIDILAREGISGYTRPDEAWWFTGRHCRTWRRNLTVDTIRTRIEAEQRRFRLRLDGTDYVIGPVLIRPGPGPIPAHLSIAAPASFTEFAALAAPNA